MKNLDIKEYKIAVIYDILLTLQVPLVFLYITCVSLLDFLADQAFMIFSILASVYWIFIFYYGIENIKQSFRKYKQQDDRYCVNAMLIMKYGLVCFFIVNFLVIALCYLISTFAALAGSRGLFLVLLPAYLPWILFFINISVIITWLMMLPGSFYGLQVIRFAYQQKKITRFTAMLHAIAQFIFLLDVLDAMYLSVKKWQMGRKSSTIVAIVYIIGILLSLYLMICILT